jgi:predicted permease
VQQALLESLVVASVGGGLGLLLGRWGTAWLAHRALATTTALPPIFAADWRVLTFTACVSIGTTIFCGLAPLASALAGGRTKTIRVVVRSTTAGRAMRTMQSLVVVQVVLSVAVVTAALLLGRTLVNYGQIDPGFDVDGLIALTVDGSEIPAEARADLPRQLIEAANTVPGVMSASVAVCGLIENCSYTTNATIDGVERPIDIRRNWVGPGYFRTAGVRMLMGREFEAQDVASSPRVAVVTESIVKRDFAGVSPIGRLVRIGDEAPAEVVGVVSDIRAKSVREVPTPTVWLPIEQPPATVPIATRRLEARIPRATANTIAELRGALLRSAPGLKVTSASTLQSRIADTLSRERLIATLASAFAGLSLVLATIGLYGVLSHVVASRSREIGVRSALGATRVQVLTLVLTQGAFLTGMGMAGGIGLAAGCTRYLGKLLFGVSPLDPATFVGAVAVFAAVSALACYIPARRATRVDPLVVLRTE